ncbi:N-acetyltransferase [Cryobacterium flavum]|uniref:N-acetyltransferase n=2 Tax=Cryobacterium flavum TaxID=1424659 RepID=A0ABY2I2A3_9MICO|nr:MULTISPECIES: GNAT family N-acetyltransferase [Cryobacterium]TFB75044.1 N-acetyltransferase [Cryobacterium flavum]
MTNASYRFSARTGDMDREQIHAWLSREAYWATGRPRALQDAAIDASTNFGMFDSASGRQVAYARVVTDSVTFAWLCDVFVDPKVRGHGVGVALMENVCALLDDLNLKRVVLSTGDAHGLYEKFGFEPLAQPEKWMARTAATPET